MSKDFSIGCNGRGAIHRTPLSVDDQFRMVKESGVFDHFDRMPQPGEEKEYLDAAHKHDLPITTGLWSYMIGRDEEVVESNLRLCKEAGAECHNLMILKHHNQGHIVTDQEVVDFYKLAYGLGEKIGITIGFEVHIYMWSEDQRRITPVAEMVRKEGIPFNFVLDHSHVLLKVDNAEEQDASGIRADVEAGKFIIDPYEEGNVVDEWINQNMTIWLQIRPASPNGPKNPFEMTDTGSYGRACQYPFVRPEPGEWHLPWSAYRVEPCKEIVRRTLRHHRDNPDSPLRWITTDMIDMPDYGGGVNYSIFDQNVAIATWFRKTWDEIKSEPSP
ncbi:MAG: xylose isomerase [Alphaproteobacteria bacterium]|nr:xylose isomerase [Alphaproteobacteria bacterium]